MCIYVLSTVYRFPCHYQADLHGFVKVLFIIITSLIMPNVTLLAEVCGKSLSMHEVVRVSSIVDVVGLFSSPKEFLSGK